MARHPTLSALLVLALCSLPACAANTGAVAAERGDGRVITAEQIRRSGASDAWEVLRRSGTHLSLRETRAGQPGTIRKRGQSSLYLSSSPIVVVDGTPMVDIDVLRQIPARIIFRVEILNGVEGTRRFGTGAGNGVVMITTSTPEG